jgi:uncharacterized protein
MANETQPRTLPPALRVTALLALLALVLLVSVRWMNNANLYPGVMINNVDAPALCATIDIVREVAFTTDDDVRLYGWVLGPDEAPRKIIQFMGNGECVGVGADTYARTAEALSAQYLLFDYRGFGQSRGSPSEPGLYADARGAYAFAVGELGWQPGQIILWGRSLGGGPATKLALELVAASRSPAALILEAPFTSVAEIANVHMGYVGRPEWLTYAAYNNLARAPGLELPVFHFHGTEDRIIPFEQGVRLHQALPGPKEFFALEGAGHNNLGGRGELLDRIDAFLKEHA